MTAVKSKLFSIHFLQVFAHKKMFGFSSSKKTIIDTIMIFMVFEQGLPYQAGVCRKKTGNIRKKTFFVFYKLPIQNLGILS